jgi:hypothetical protein
MNRIGPDYVMQPTHVYEIRLRKDHRGVDLASDPLPFGRLWYGEPNAISNAIGYAKFRSRSHRAVIRVYDEAGNVIGTYEQAGEFRRFYWENLATSWRRKPIIISAIPRRPHQRTNPDDMRQKSNKQHHGTDERQNQPTNI